MKPRKILSFLLATAMTISLLPTFTITVSAEEYTGTLDEDTGLYYTKYDTYCEITDCDTSVTSVTIPETIDDLPVTSIGDNAFNGCGSLTTITIGNSITNIGYDAFAFTGYYDDSSNWENGVLYIGNYLIKANSISGNINIKNGTKLIADSAFVFSEGLKIVTIPNTVTSIGNSAFSACRRLASIEIPDSVTSIGEGAFYDCDSLTSITIGNSVTSIGYDAFCNTGYFNEEVNWENGVLYIGNYLIKAYDISGNINIKEGTKSICGGAFECCDGLTGVTIPDTITSIGKNTFFSCSRLESITIPDTVTSIGEYAFYYCSNLKSITIPDSVTSIGECAFCLCEELTSIKLPKGITTISDAMFKNCKNLTSLDIPNGVTIIDSEAFYGCNGLNCINYDGTKKEWKKISINNENNGNDKLNNVTINYLREPETTTTVSGKTFTVTGKNIDGYTVILALYKDDGQGGSQLVDCQTAVYDGNAKTFTTTVTDYTSAKVMVWKDLETLEPVTEVEIVNLG